MSRVIATKGMSKARTLTSTPSPVELRTNGKTIRRGYKVWPIGVDIAKSELYGWLRLTEPDAPGYCHFPELEEEFFKQLTSEHLVTTRNTKGYLVREWQLIPGRENHVLDCRIMARAAAAVVGLDRIAAASSRRRRPRVAPPPPSEPVSQESDTSPASETIVQELPESGRSPSKKRKKKERSGGGWLKGGRVGIGNRGKGGWLR
jgi:phage terminase large subunit GpA-like protein